MAASARRSVQPAVRRPLPGVRVRGGKRMVTDGPFAETREQLGGYYVIDVPNLDEAIAIASRLPPAAKGVVEIRPIHELGGLPQQL